MAIAHRMLTAGKWTVIPSTGWIRSAQTGKRVDEKRNNSGYRIVGVHVPGVCIRCVLVCVGGVQGAG
jgi:hypothetical protein